MSSIFGKCNNENTAVTSGELELMAHELNHWNADVSGIWANDRAGLGHLMLFNTPESLNEQLPLYDGVLQLSVTADARIDNRDELYTLLQINTPDEKLLPDSKIILLLYKKYGEECVKYLVGDFAFSIWDEAEQKLFCARDHMGVKPFFYYCDTHFFAFASEKKGLLCMPDIDKSIDKQFYYNQLLLPRIQAADTTLYKSIKRLAPAHSLTYYPSKKQLRLNHYWTLDAYAEVRFGKVEDYYEALCHYFEVAVKCRLRSHFPVGTELSGGLDSSAITGVASHFMKKTGSNIVTFSNVSGEGKTGETQMPGKSERQFAEAVIQFNNIEDHVFVTEDIWADPLDEIDFALKVNDGLELWSLLWQAAIKKVAMEKNVRTLLSGFPGDELVTYRGQYQLLDLLDKKKYASYFSAKSGARFNKLKPFVPAEAEYWLHKIKNISALNNYQVKRTSDFIDIPLKWRFIKGDVAWKDDTYRQRFDSYRHFQKHRLLKPQVPLRMEAETRFGIGFRTEPRFPMADIRLTQFFLSLPNEMKGNNDENRYVFKKSLLKYLPQSVLSRNDKSGNTAPFRTTPSEIKKRQEALKKLLNIYTDIDAKLPDNIHDLMILLELLRWRQSSKEML